MNKNVLLIVGSPKGKKGNSEALLDYLQKNIADTFTTTKVVLRKEMNAPEKLIKLFNTADFIIVSYPIYQNSFPGLVQQFFELIMSNKASLDKKTRRMVAISNSGLTELEANTCSIEQCKLFAQQTELIWGCGIMVAPGALIDGKDLSQTGKMYAKTRYMLEDIARRINTNDFNNFTGYPSHMKSLFNPVFYRVAGRLLQSKVIKKLGKSVYYQRPLIHD